MAKIVKIESGHKPQSTYILLKTLADSSIYDQFFAVFPTLFSLYMPCLYTRWQKILYTYLSLKTDIGKKPEVSVSDQFQ